MILGLDHKPQPPTEIVQRLKQIDPRLGLALRDGVDPKTQRIVPRWWITLDWLPTDRRHELVRAGDLPIDECFDAIQALPLDCGVEEAYGYIVQAFKAWDGSSEDVRRVRERVHAFNRKRQDEVIQPVLDYAEEMLQHNFGPTRVSAVTHTPRESREKQERRFREGLAEAQADAEAARGDR